jgi:hypothetical protein
MVIFDRFGKCPICRHPFRGDDCPHSYAYVVKVLEAADKEDQFTQDVALVRKSRK